MTRIIDPLSQLEGIPPDILAAAARFGSHVHLACHLANMGTLDELRLDLALVPYVQGWRKFLADTGAIVVDSERRVWHPRHKYAGQLDAIIEWHAGRHLVDIKSSARVPRSVGAQTAGYREAYVAEGGHLNRTRYCVHLLGNGDYRLHRLTNPSDFVVFLSALNICKWLSEPCPI